MRTTSIDLVIPTLGRASLAPLLERLERQQPDLPGRLVIVHDALHGEGELRLGEVGPKLSGRVEVLQGTGRGPAAARNIGWRACDAEWVAFLDDDVIPEDDWLERLITDLTRVPRDVGGVQGNVVVPLRSDRKPTDWERNVSGLERGEWVTADMAYRRTVLSDLGGFDERFPRAYREDADLALRTMRAGHRLLKGSRRVVHPVPPAAFWASVWLQKGNVDDALMRGLHGTYWYRPSEGPRGRRPGHIATTLIGVGALATALARRPRPARVAAGVWAAGVAQLAWLRIQPGPRTAGEVSKMIITSALIPPTATSYWVLGLWRRRSLLGGRNDPSGGGKVVRLDEEREVRWAAPASSSARGTGGGAR